jgi:hypothetical protein
MSNTLRRKLARKAKAQVKRDIPEGLAAVAPSAWL